MVAIVSVSGHFHHILKQSTVIFSSQKKSYTKIIYLVITVLYL